MVVAVVGVPGGLELRLDRLQELRRSGLVASYEITSSNNLHLYWDGLHPGQVTRVALDAIASVPGVYKGRASRAYVYYDDEHQHWLEGTTVVIVPAGRGGDDIEDEATALLLLRAAEG
ncbi:unnamed protein product [Discosporangium mesarthrocarpum]